MFFDTIRYGIMMFSIHFSLSLIKIFINRYIIVVISIFCVPIIGNNAYAFSNEKQFYTFCFSKRNTTTAARCINNDSPH